MKLSRSACQPVFIPYTVTGGNPTPNAFDVSLDGEVTWLATQLVDGGGLILLAGYAWAGTVDPPPAAVLTKGAHLPVGRVSFVGAPAVVDVAPDAIYVD